MVLTCIIKPIFFGKALIAVLHFRMKRIYTNEALCILIILYAGEVLLCPDRCACSIDTDGVLVKCEYRGLTEIPKLFPNDTHRM